MEKDKKQSLIAPPVVLGAICLVTTLLLSVANAVTKDKIAEIATQKYNEGCAAVLSADAYEPVEDVPEEIESAVIARDTSGVPLGVCVELSLKGYSDGLNILVGVDTGGTVTGVYLISHAETPGLGANASKPEFLAQFTGKTEGLSAKKGGGAEGNEIDAITGATVTSKAMTDGVNTAIKFSKELLGGEPVE